MKKLKPKEIRKYTDIAVIFGAVVILLANVSSGWFAAVGAVICIAGLALDYRFCRCPHCSAYINTNRVFPYCPHCGKPLDE